MTPAQPQTLEMSKEPPSFVGPAVVRRKEDGDKTTMKVTGRLFVPENDVCVGSEECYEREVSVVGHPVSPGSCKKKGRTLSGKGYLETLKRNLVLTLLYLI